MEQQLLLGLLALQNEFVSLEHLKAALVESLESQLDFKDCLTRQAELAVAELDALERLLAVYLKRYEGDAASALDSLSSVAEAHREISEIVSKMSPEKLGTLSWFSNATRTAAVSHGPLAPPASQSEDRFRIVRKHAEGGLGVVFIAEDNQIRRNVALKQIKPERADEQVYRDKFSQEAEITGQLEHPGIVPIYAFGTDADGRPYYAMRFIEGESLRDRIKDFHQKLASKEMRLDGPELRALLRRFIDVCNAVAYANERGVLHRDLKPGNVMLGKFGETLLVDWGLAKNLNAQDTGKGTSHEDETSQSSSRLSGSETQQGQFLGTAAYSPPEQLEGRIDELSERTDVYSLGAILHEILTGKPPVTSAQTTIEAIEQIERLQSHLNLIPSTPPALPAIARKSLHKDALSRYASASELKSDVQSWLDDDSVSAYEEPLLERLQRWVKNHKTLASSLSIGVLGVLAASTVYGIADSNAQTAKYELQLAEAQARDNNSQRLLSESLSAEYRGDSQLVIQQLGELREFKGELSVDEKLRLARHLLFDQQPAEAYAILIAIAEQAITAKQRAGRALLLGDLLFGTKADAEGKKLLEQALASGALATSDELYTQGILAETPVDAEELLQDCIQLDPYHSYARARLAMTQVILGKTQSALRNSRQGSQLHPKDWRFAAIRALAYATLVETELMELALQELEQVPQASENSGLIRLSHTVHKLVAASAVPGAKNPSFSELAKLVPEFSVIQALTSTEKEFSVAIPKLGWFGSLYDALDAPELNVISLTIWFAQNRGTGVVKRLGEMLPEHKLYQTVLATILLQESNGEPDLIDALLERAESARNAETNIGGLDATLALVVAQALAYIEPKVYEDPVLRPQQVVRVADWRLFLMEHATREKPLPDEAYFPIWGLFVRNAFQDDALKIAEYQIEREDLSEEEHEIWVGRLALSKDKIAFTNEWIDELVADPRFYPEDAEANHDPKRIEKQSAEPEAAPSDSNN